MKNQDESLEELGKIIHRQKEIGLVINDELIRQNKMLDDLTSDTDRVENRQILTRKKLDRVFQSYY